MGKSPEKPPDAAVSFGEMETEESYSDISRRVVDGAVWVAGLRWGTLLVSWPATIILARLLRPEDFGYLALVTVFTRFATLIAEGGIGTTVVLGEALSDSSYRRLHSWSIFLFLIATVILVALSIPIEHLYDTPGVRWVLLAFTFGVMLQGVTLVPVSRMRRELRFRELSIMQALSVIGEAIISVIFAALGFSYWSLVFGFLAGRILFSALVLRAYSLVPKFPTLEGLHSFLRDARRVLLASVSTFLAESSDAWVGGIAAGATALGGYTFMSGVARAPLDKVSGIVMYVSGSALGTVRESPERLKRVMLRMIRVVGIILLPIFTGIALVGEDLVQGVLGGKWHPYLASLQIYCVYALLLPLRDTLKQGAVAAGASADVARTGLMLLMIMPLGFFLLGDRWGATGLALTWLLPVPLIFNRLLWALSLRISLGWTDFLRALLRPVLAVLIMALVVQSVSFLDLVANSPPLLRLGIRALIGAVTYIGIAFWLMKSDISWTIDQISPRLPKRTRRIIQFFHQLSSETRFER